MSEHKHEHQHRGLLKSIWKSFKHSLLNTGVMTVIAGIAGYLTGFVMIDLMGLNFGDTFTKPVIGLFFGASTAITGVLTSVYDGIKHYAGQDKEHEHHKQKHPEHGKDRTHAIAAEKTPQVGQEAKLPEKVSLILRDGTRGVDPEDIRRQQAALTDAKPQIH